MLSSKILLEFSSSGRLVIIVSSPWEPFNFSCSWSELIVSVASVSVLDEVSVEEEVLI